MIGTTVRRYNPERGLWGADARGAFIGRLVKRKISDDRFAVRKGLYDDGTLVPETWVCEATRIADAEGD